MIRILHSVSNMDRAGIETMLMNYYRHIDRTKIQFDFLCNKEKPGAYDDEIRALGGRIFHTPGLNPLKYPKYLRYMRKLFSEYPEYRIVHTHNGAFGAYALHAAKKNKIPVRIFHAHGASIAKDLKYPLKLFCRARLPKCMTEHYTCGVDSAVCYFGKKVVAAGDYVFIPNAIAIDRFLFNSETREKIRMENGLADKHVVGHVGNYTLPKNHMFLLEIFADFKKKDPKACLVLIGGGERMEDVKKKAQELGIFDSVRFMGSLSNVNEWYQAFDVFVMPSLREGLPVVGVEAQAADLPCIFSKSVTKEIGILEKTRFVGLEEDRSQWVKAIEDALNNSQRTNVRDMITAHGYDIETEAKKLQERYFKLLGEKA